jgi:oxepin-CoA hydrolase/3-oxo-5,6-dehydrosuberyl-CoA semialdehyde dehydrogenase
MLEKLAPTLLAGVPAIVKPATSTSYVAEACFRMIVESGILPDGAVQFIAGGTGDLLDRLTPQDVVSFTGSAATALMLRSNPHILRHSIRFIAEQDSLNASILGSGCRAGHARIRPLRQGGGQGDDGQGRTEMHGHPPHHCAESLRRRP